MPTNRNLPERRDEQGVVRRAGANLSTVKTLLAESRPEHWFERAMAHKAAADWIGADYCLGRFLILKPTDCRGWLIRSYVSAELGNAKDCVDALLKAEYHKYITDDEIFRLYLDEQDWLKILAINCELFKKGVLESGLLEANFLNYYEHKLYYYEYLLPNKYADKDYFELYAAISKVDRGDDGSSCAYEDSATRFLDFLHDTLNRVGLRSIRKATGRNLEELAESCLSVCLAWKYNFEFTNHDVAWLKCMEHSNKTWSKLLDNDYIDLDIADFSFALALLISRKIAYVASRYKDKFSKNLRNKAVFCLRTINKFQNMGYYKTSRYGVL